jgi:hypothetical protein
LHDLRCLIAHLLHEGDQLGLLFSTSEAGDLLGCGLRGLRKSQDFRKLLIEDGELRHISPLSLKSMPVAAVASMQTATAGTERA